MAEPCGVPNQHVIINLDRFSSEHDGGKPVRQPPGSEHLMVELLLERFFCLHVLNEKDGEEMSFKEHIDKSRAHLNYCQIKDEELAQNWK